jgi:hypothetical protein
MKYLGRAGLAAPTVAAETWPAKPLKAVVPIGGEA